MGRAVTTHSPSLLETVTRVTPMVALVMDTSAPATMAPEVSRTVPVNVAVSCAKAAPEAQRRNASRQQAWRRNFMYISKKRGMRADFAAPKCQNPKVLVYCKARRWPQSSWQAALGRAREQESRQVG